ncbi:MAG TPA: ribosomal protein S18-alanine N-acetyltransferase [Candidatus Krumholzibacteria bacterium]|nr:ribosomal protein S18-alanine N-acetyltransferase [Candidatus Krumholzibacteria bacterium]
MSELKIRPATLSDLSTIRAMEASIFPTPWSEEMIAAELSGDPLRIALLALQEEIPVGYIFCWAVADELHVVNLGVIETQRRKGHGQALLQAVLKHPRAREASLVTLEVRVDNESARAFYRRNGFKEIALRKGYYPDTGEDALVMLKNLGSEGGFTPDPAPR